MSLSTSPILAAAASNDVAATRWLIEHERVHVDELGDWFGCPDVATSGSAKHAKSASLKRKRRTPLMVAATHGSVDALSYLLRAGADPNCRSDDDEKATALHCAASGGSAMSVDCVTALLRFGADGRALDGFGREPADVLPRNARHDGSTNGTTNGSSTNGQTLLNGAQKPFERAALFARGRSPSSSGSAGSSPPSGEDRAYERTEICRLNTRGSGSSGGGDSARASPASLSGSGSAGSFGFASFGEQPGGGGGYVGIQSGKNGTGGRRRRGSRRRAPARALALAGPGQTREFGGVAAHGEPELALHGA